MSLSASLLEAALTGQTPPQMQLRATAATGYDHQRAVAQTRFSIWTQMGMHSLIICKAYYYKLFLSPLPINEQMPRGNADISKYSARKGSL